MGALIVQHVQAEPDGPCHDVVFDPTVLPEGMQTSDDPFPAARSAAYASFTHAPRGCTLSCPGTEGWGVQEYGSLELE